MDKKEDSVKLYYELEKSVIKKYEKEFKNSKFGTHLVKNQKECLLLMVILGVLLIALLSSLIPVDIGEIIFEFIGFEFFEIFMISLLIVYLIIALYYRICFISWLKLKYNIKKY